MYETFVTNPHKVAYMMPFDAEVFNFIYLYNNFNVKILKEFKIA